MRKIGRRGGDLDLTPLLDVIFIILMVVMCNQTLLTKESKAETADMRKELDACVAENIAVKDQLSAMENEEDIISYVTLSASYDSDNPRIRHFKLIRNNETEIEDIVIIPEKEDEAFKRVEEELDTFVAEWKDKPVLIVLDKDQILYRDYQKLDEYLSKLHEKYNNIFRTDK
ncbi:hypothetical protein [Butyrivibrio sp. MC2013]|uniref:hypothetical protein n=1 Tax=Butyrivibrio sp. MC2013 TaxID=1280686 RepID=UPI0003FF6E51|nr:hypothetical protein [Butyrivibrio sp. MC2013]